MKSLLFTLLLLALLVTVGVLFTGLVAMARGGAFNQKYANKLMRLRIVSQLVALLLFTLLFWLVGR